MRGRLFYGFSMIFEVPGNGKIKQNHDTVIKNQGFAEFLQTPSGDRFFIDFDVHLGYFEDEFGALQRFLREKARCATAFKI